MTSQAIIVRRRSHRSTRTPASGPRKTLGTAVIAKVMPTSRAVPRVATSVPSAMTWIRSPISEISCPVHSRLKLRFANRRRYGDWRRRPAASAPASERSAGMEPDSA